MKKTGMRRSAFARGFTLLEMLVAVAILVLISVVVFSIVQGVSGAIAVSSQRQETVSQARIVLARIGMDIANQIRRPDIPYGYSHDLLQFYTEAASYNSTRKIILVGYRVNPRTHIFERAALDLNWDADVKWFLPADKVNTFQASFDPGIKENNWTEFSSQIFRFEVSFLYNDSVGTPRLYTSPPDKVERLVALVVTVATLDSINRLKISDSQLETLVSALPAPYSDYPDALAYWEKTIRSPGFSASANVPVAVASAVRCYQQYFPIK